MVSFVPLKLRSHSQYGKHILGPVYERWQFRKLACPSFKVILIGVNHFLFGLVVSFILITTDMLLF